MFFRLLPIAALALLWWRAPENVRRVGRTLRDAPSTILTQTDMGNVRSAVAYYYLEHDRFPYGQLETFCQQNVAGPARRGRDRWGTLYQLESLEDATPLLRSCGADTECQSEDDLTQRVIARQKPGAEREPRSD